VLPVLLVGLSLLGLARPAAGQAPQVKSPGPATGAAPDTARPSRAWIATLPVEELGFDGALRIRVFYAPDYIAFPAPAGHLFLVAADSSRGRDAFFISSDLAFELGSRQVYPAEFERASDLFGQALGGRLRPGETQLGFVLVPAEARIEDFLPGNPDSLRIRYANRRASFRPATPEEIAAWTKLIPRKVLALGLNSWWDWTRAMQHAPPMTAGEARFFAERMFPGQGEILAEERINPEALRNAILRVGERRLLEGPARQRVYPLYPTAVRQMGIGGLVIALCYVDTRGEVADATVLASNTVHLLNLSALSAAMQFRYPVARGEDGKPTDGWRILPFQFRLEKPAAEAATAESLAAGDTTGLGPYQPPQIVKRVEPEYPDRARRKKIEGTVVYRATISPEGKLVQAELEKSVDPLLDEAALTALEHTLFLPASRGGVSVKGEILVPFTFGKPRDRR
jgi:TonB family protein